MSMENGETTEGTLQKALLRCNNNTKKSKVFYDEMLRYM